MICISTYTYLTRVIVSPKRRTIPHRTLATTNFLTATAIQCSMRAGITAAAGTRLALSLIIFNDFAIKPFQCYILYRIQLVISRHYLLALRVGNFRACCLPWM